MKHTQDVLSKMRRNLDGPGWRYRLAQAQQIEPAQGLPGSDELVRHTAHYLKLLQEGTPGNARADRKYPRIAEALQLW